MEMAGVGALGSIKFETWLKYPCLKLQRGQWLADRWMGAHEGMRGNSQGKGDWQTGWKGSEGRGTIEYPAVGGLLGAWEEISIALLRATGHDWAWKSGAASGRCCRTEREQVT